MQTPPQKIDDPFFTQRMLVSLFLKKILNAVTQPLVICCILAWWFKKDKDGMRMRTCANVGSPSLVTLHLSRAGLCSQLNLILKGVEDVAKDLSKKSRQGVVASHVAPLVWQMHEMQHKKDPTTCTSIRMSNSMTGVDWFLVKMERWSKAVPCTLDICVNLFSQFFDGNEWKKVLDTALPIKAKCNKNDTFSFCLLHSGVIVAGLSASSLGIPVGCLQFLGLWQDSCQVSVG